MRTAVKNRVHALLARQGILPEQTDLFGKAGRGFLASLELPEGSRRRLDSLMSLIDDFDFGLRTEQLRRRYLTTILDGMRAGDGMELPGPPPSWRELNERWVT